jgi:hypothetical protein
VQTSDPARTGSLFGSDARKSPRISTPSWTTTCGGNFRERGSRGATEIHRQYIVDVSVDTGATPIAGTCRSARDRGPNADRPFDWPARRRQSIPIGILSSRLIMKITPLAVAALVSLAIPIARFGASGPTARRQRLGHAFEARIERRAPAGSAQRGRDRGRSPGHSGWRSYSQGCALSDRRAEGTAEG